MRHIADDSLPTLLEPTHTKEALRRTPFRHPPVVGIPRFRGPRLPVAYRTTKYPFVMGIYGPPDHIINNHVTVVSPSAPPQAAGGLQMLGEPLVTQRADHQDAIAAGLSLSIAAGGAAPPHRTPAPPSRSPKPAPIDAAT
jgi:hypothetical protein